MSFNDDIQMRLKWDSSQFDKAAENTLKLLGRVDETLGSFAKSGLSGIDSLANSFSKLNIDGLNSAIEGVSSHFTLFGRIGEEAIGRIASSVVNLGSQLTDMVGQLTIEPIKTGFNEYGLLMDSTQVILANTGESLDTVDAALESLNKYADRTIYNFSHMTNAIGRFSAAGVELEDSVAAIQGLSNLSAYVGVNAEQNSMAMNALSKALSSGAMKRTQWLTFETTGGLAGPAFRDELIATAKELGYFDRAWTNSQGKMIDGAALLAEAQTNFRDTLIYGWADTDVLIKTLSKFTDETTELGQAAYKAATEVRTWDKLWDALKEAAQSSWSETYKYVFGNYEEATKFWTELNDEISKYVSLVGDSRNETLKFWHDTGGRNDLLEGLKNVYGYIKEVAKPITDAIKNTFEWFTLKPDEKGTILDYASEKFKEWSQNLHLARENGQKLHNIMLLFLGRLAAFKEFISLGGLKNIFGIIKNVGEILLNVGNVIAGQVFKKFGTNFKNIGEIFYSVSKSVLDLTDSIANFTNSDRFKYLGSMIGEVLRPLRVFVSYLMLIPWGTVSEIGYNAFMLILDVLSAIGMAVNDVFKFDDLYGTYTKVQKFFEDILDIVMLISEYFSAPDKERLYDENVGKGWRKLRKTITGVLSVFKLIGSVISQIWDFISKNFIGNSYLESEEKGLLKVLDTIMTITSTVGDWITKIAEVVEKYNLVYNVLEVIKSALEPIVGLISDILWDTITAFEQLTGIDLPFNDGFHEFVDGSVAVNESIEESESGFEHFAKTLNENIDEIKANVHDFSSTVSKNIYSAFSVIRNFVEKLKIVETVTNLLYPIRNFFQQFSKTSGSTVLTMFYNIGDIIGTIISSFSVAVRQVFQFTDRTSTLSKIVETLAGWIQKIKDYLNSDFGQSVLVRGFSGALSILRLIWDVGSQIVQGLLPFISHIFEMMTPIFNIVAGLFRYVGDIFRWLERIVRHNQLIEKFMGVITAFITPIIDGLGSVLTVIGTIASDLLGIDFLSVEENFKLTGAKHHLQAFAEWLSEKLGWLTEVAGAVGSAIGNAIASFGLDIPSILETFGNFVGFVIGGIQSLTESILGFFGIKLDKGDESLMGEDGTVLIEEKLSLFDQLKQKLPILGRLFGETGESAGGFFSIFKNENTDGVEKHVSVFERFINALVWIKDRIVELATGIVNAISAFAQSISESIGGFSFDNFFNMMSSLLTAKGITSVINFLREMTAGVKEGKGLLASIKEIGESITETFSAMQDKLKSDALMKLAISIGLLTAACFVLSTIDKDKLSDTLLAIGVLFAEAVGGFKLFTMGTSELKTLKLGQLASAFIKVAAAILILTIAMKQVAELSWEDMFKGLIAIGGLLAELIIASKFFQEQKGFTSAAVGLIILAIALKLLVKPLIALGALPLGNLIQGLVAVGALLAGLYLFINNTNLDNLGVFKAVGILLLTSAIKKLSKVVVTLGTLKLDSLVKGLVAIAILLTEIAAFCAVVEKVNVGIIGGIGLVLLAVSMKVFASVVKQLGRLDLWSLIKGLYAFAVTLTMLTVALNAMPVTTPLVAAGLLILSVALAVISTTISLLGKLKITTIVKAFIALAGALAIFGIASAVLTPVIPAMIGVAAALALLGVSVVTIGVGIMALSAGLSALGISFAVTGESVVAGAGLIIMTVINLIPTIIANVINGIVMLIKAILAAIPEILTALSKIASAILDAIVELAPKVVEAGFGLLMALLRGIRDHIGEIVTCVGEIITNFLDALGTQIPKIVDAMGRFVLEVINGIAEAIRGNGEPIFAALRNLLSSLLELILSALQEVLGGIPWIGDKISDGLDLAKNKVRKFIAPESFKEVGDNAGGALVDGFKESANNVTLVEEGKKATDTFAEGVVEEAPVVNEAGTSIIDNIVGGIQSTNLFDVGSGDIGQNLMDGLMTKVPGMSDIGNSLTDSMVGGLENTDLFNIGSENLGQNLLDGIMSQSGDMNLAGIDLTGEMTNGLESLNLFNVGADQLGQPIVNGLESKKDEMTIAGKDVTQGAVDGIQSSGTGLSNAGSWIGSTILNGFKKVLGINSPSKVFYNDTGYIGIGIIKRLKDQCTDIKKSTDRYLISPFLSASDAISDLVSGDIEYNPRINPVVDISSAKNSINTMNSMFGDKSINLAASTMQLSSENAARRAKDRRASVYNDKNVVSAIGNLQADMQGLQTVMSGMGLYLDGNTLVGGIASKMDMQLGVNRARKVRIGYGKRG